MKIKRILSTCIIVISTTILVISSWKSQVQSSSASTYESRRPIQNEIYYYKPSISETVLTSNDVSNKSIKVTPTPIIVGERVLVGIETSQVSDLKIEKEVKDEPIIKNRWNITLSKDEIELLAKIVWTESRGESDKGERAVIEAIFNRMIHWDFEGSLYDVLSAEGQFCSWSLRNEAEPTDKEYKNIKKVLDGETDILGFNKVYFSTSARNNIDPIKIGGHWFCDYEYSSKKDKE